MNANKARWETGDFTRIAECIRKTGEELVRTLSITQGLRVLDLGCGDVNSPRKCRRLLPSI